MSPQLHSIEQAGRFSLARYGDSPLAVGGLSVAYDSKPVVWNLDFVAPERALVAIVGPNGAGKSTLIKAVLGLVPSVAGEVRIFGRPPARQRRAVAYMPQRESVDWDFPASALDVVAMGLYGRIGWCRPVLRRHREEAHHCLERVGMVEFADRQIGQLSGGQQQRVFLARALAQDAQLYLMDEPLAGVDKASEQVILEQLSGLKQAGKTVVCVHHDLQSAPRIFDHALIMNVRAVASGPIDRVFTERNLQEAYGGRLAPSELTAIALRA